MRKSSKIAPGTMPAAYANGFVDALISYELVFAVDDFTLSQVGRSDIIRHVAEVLCERGIRIGPQAVDIELTDSTRRLADSA